jgi:DNA polymerase III subunit gamma/tau
MTNNIPWNRKYRPTKVQDLHLDSVRTQLQRMMDAGKIPQALLFAGPKGTGKTSSSRIIGALVNDPNNYDQIESVYFNKKRASKSKNSNKKLVEPDDSSNFAKKIFEGSSFVVQEMDAASNRGIDDIRQLKTKAFMPPQTGKMSVFILDEAHMLTTEAFNALLKLLEEPPEHTIFILATTEIHKIPATITSRCQTIEFHKATNKELLNTLKQILINEKIKFEEEALEIIIKRADGSFRDAIKLLEMTAQAGKVTIKEVEVYASASIDGEITNLIDNLLNKDEVEVVKVFENLRNKNIEQKFFHKSLLETLHTSLLQNLNVKKGQPIVNQKVAQFLLTQLSDAFLSTPSPIPHLTLELKILELIDRSKNKGGKNKQVKKNPEKLVSSNSSSNLESDSIQDINYDESLVSVVNTPTDSITVANFSINNKKDTPSATKRAVKAMESLELNGDGNKLCEKWHNFVDLVAENNSTIASLLRSAKPMSGKVGLATIGVFYKFHQEQLTQPKFNALIQEFVKNIADGYLKLDFILTQAPAKAELVEVNNTESLSQVASQALM